MTTLVTGATGFVGSHVARQLVSAGQSVRALVRRRSNLEALAGLDLEYFEGDLRDAGGFSTWLPITVCGRRDPKRFTRTTLKVRASCLRRRKTPALSASSIPARWQRLLCRGMALFPTKARTRHSMK